MAYKRRRKQSSKAIVPYKRQRYTGYRPRMTQSMALAVLSRRTAGYVGLERKFLDASLANTALVAPTDASGGEIDANVNCSGCLSAPAIGDGPSNRDGRQISISNITIKGSIDINPQSGITSAADTVPDIFIALVLDKQTNGAQLNSEDVFENPLGGNLTATQVFRALDNRERFQVLKTKRITAKDIAGSIIPFFEDPNVSQQGVKIPFSMYKSFGKGLKVNFLAGLTTATVNAVADNSLHLIAYCSDTSTAPSVSYNSRMRFYG